MDCGKEFQTKAYGGSTVEMSDKIDWKMNKKVSQSSKQLEILSLGGKLKFSQMKWPIRRVFNLSFSRVS